MYQIPRWNVKIQKGKTKFKIAVNVNAKESEWYQLGQLGVLKRISIKKVKLPRVLNYVYHGISWGCGCIDTRMFDIGSSGR
jgi:hypothetical protein